MSKWRSWTSVTATDYRGIKVDKVCPQAERDEALDLLEQTNKRCDEDWWTKRDALLNRLRIGPNRDSMLGKHHAEALEDIAKAIRDAL